MIAAEGHYGDLERAQHPLVDLDLDRLALLGRGCDVLGLGGRDGRRHGGDRGQKKVQTHQMLP